MKKKIIISMFEFLDLGGIATSAYNFIWEMSKYYDIDLCVLTNVISPKYKFPENLHILPFPNKFEYIYGDKSRMTGNLVQKMYKNLLRCIRKFNGYEQTLPFAMKGVKFEKEYDIAIAFWNDSYDKNGIMNWGGDYYNIIHNVNAKYKIAWIHNDANQMGLSHKICNHIFKDFDAIVNVSQEGKDNVDSIVPEYKEKSFVVYNCYNIEEIKRKANGECPYSQNGKLHFVNVCRLSERQKKLSRILDVCKKLKSEGYSNFDWTLVGHGDNYEMYKNKIIEDGTDDVVNLVGLKPNPYPYMKYADAFIMSSLFEGLPMTIKEAQIVGTPTFSTKFGSAEEAIELGKQGEICDNSTEGLYIMVKNLIDNPQTLLSYRKYLKDNPITNELAIKQFENIILYLNNKK